jgi:hypothetical protein
MSPIVPACRFRPLIAALGALALLLLPSTSAYADSCADPDVVVRGGGQLKAVELFNEWPPGSYKGMKLGAEIAADAVETFKMYYVSKGKAILESSDTTYTIARGSAWVPQCSEGQWQVRLMKGRVDVRGERFSGSKPRSVMNSPEAIYMPLPGTPKYTVRRHPAKTKREGWAKLRVAPSSGAVWARMNGGMLFAGKEIPCQIGKTLTIFDTGRTKTS